MKLKQGVYTSTPKKEEKTTVMNVFEKAKFVEEHHTVSGNGSNKLTTSGDVFVDDFINSKLYKSPRELDEIFKDVKEMWQLNPEFALAQIAILRTITRSTKTPDGVDHGKHTGQGLKFEFFGRMYWLAIYQPETFFLKENLDIFTSIGSWDDLFEIMRLDVMYEHENGHRTLMNWRRMIAYILDSLKNDKVTNLIKKYLPTIKTAKNCTTLRTQANNYIAKYIANTLFSDRETPADRYKAYRIMKSSGNAHEFQQLISQQRYEELDFNKIPGRVLGKLVQSREFVTISGKKKKSDGTSFVERHGLEEKYNEFIEAQPVAKFTGFVYELMVQAESRMNKLQIKTVNKQFEGLVQTALEGEESPTDLIVVIDSSGSMGCSAIGTNGSAYTIAKSMALFFSYFLKGSFANTCIEFARTTKIVSWQGNTPVDKFQQTKFSGYCGNTDVLSVARLFCDLRKSNPESDFPKGVVMISDGEFDANYCNTNRYGKTNPGYESTFMTFKDILRSGGFSQEFVDEFKIILWDIPNGYYNPEGSKSFETLATCPNCFHMGGFDPAGLKFITGKTLKSDGEVRASKDMMEVIQAARDQELIKNLTVVSFKKPVHKKPYGRTSYHKRGKK